MAELPPRPQIDGDPGGSPDGGSPPATPRWVKVFALIALVAVLVFLVLLLVGGEHGPGRHLGSRDGGHTPGMHTP